MKKYTTIAAIALLAVASVVGIGYARAANDSTGNGNRGQMLDEAVSDGIVDQATADKLEAYNHEQRQTQMQEQMEERLGSAVDEGTITDDEAQQIRDWQASRPEAMEKIGGFGKGGRGGFGQGKGNCDQTAPDAVESN